MRSQPESEDLHTLLHDLRHGDEVTRDRACLLLQRLAGTLADAADNAAADERERIERWGEAEATVWSLPVVATALIGAMEDELGRVRAFAAIHLPSVPYAEAEDALVRHVHSDPHPQVRMLCISALRSRKPRPRLQVFVDALRDPEYQVVYPACIALGESGDLAAVEPLRSALDHAAWDVRYYACEALARLGAVDPRVVAELESLSTRTGAAEHDDVVAGIIAFERRFPSGAKTPLTCAQLLEEARRVVGPERP